MQKYLKNLKKCIGIIVCMILIPYGCRSTRTLEIKYEKSIEIKKYNYNYIKMKNKPPIKDYSKVNAPKLKWYTETLYIDKDNGEWIPAYKFKTDYYETDRKTNTEIKENTAVRTITVHCRRDTQQKFEWFK